jgi:NAD(P)-dependent dehydrogenase (short-subunit alcohol dehydrogenase family)
MKMSDINFDFKDKIVLVFGGSKGIGKEVCEQFLRHNAKVYCISRTNPFISNVNFIQCDISKESDISNVFSRFNKVDFVINVAGTNLCQPIENISIEEWDRLMSINLRSFFIICKQSVKLMKPFNYGRIVNVSSIAGRNKSIVSGVHYTASKYGVIGLTKQLANEVSQFNILVNSVCPSQTMTQMLKESMSNEQREKLEQSIPVKKIASTKEQAMPILFLCSSAASYIAGTTLDVNGGQL